MSPESKTLPERLLDGARMLGNLWRRGKRCSRSWEVGDRDMAVLVAPLPFVGAAPFTACDCNPKTDFCKAKMLWLALAIQAGQDLEGGDYGLALTMTPAQWDATGLTVTFPIEGGQVAVGPKGSMSMRHFRELSKDRESARSIFALLKVFPKARVEGIIEPEKVA